MARKRIVVVGSSLAGLAATMELAKRLNGRHEIVVVSNTEMFVFIPSLIWVPFGKRTGEDISFPLPPLYRKKEIRFIHATATRFDLKQRVVETTEGPQVYDYLLVAPVPSPIMTCSQASVPSGAIQCPSARWSAPSTRLGRGRNSYT